MTGEETEISEYEIDYDYDDKDLDVSEEIIRENKLPKVVLNFEKVATEYSRGNNVPAIITFYSILGDLVKHFSFVPFGPTGQDTRIHFLNIQTARTGKTTLLTYVVKPVAEKLYKVLKDDKYVNGDYMERNSYTTASLIGSFRENKKFEEYQKDPEKAHTEYTDDLALLVAKREAQEMTESEYQRGRVRAGIVRDRKLQADYVIKGPLDGEGLLILDEFHDSGIFTKQQHKDGLMSLFQNLMNPMDRDGNSYNKTLNDKVGKPMTALQEEELLVLEIDCKRTFLMLTYPPDNLEKSITKAGLLQRPLGFIRDVPEHELEVVRSAITLSAGNYDLYRNSKENAEHLHEGILAIYELTKERFKKVGKDRTKTVVWEKGSAEALEAERLKLGKLIKNLPLEMRMIIKLFEPNLVEYIAKLATLNCMCMAPSITKGALQSDEDVGRFLLTPLHIRQGGNIVRTCYLALVEWMETHMTKKRKTLKESPMGKLFQQAYKQAMESALPRQKREGGYVWKTLVIQKACEIAGQSLPTINKQFNIYQGNESGKKEEGKTEMYDVIKQGRQEYIKPKEA